ncbi:uncharacterized protein LOC123654679 [Melitaea cinxia]|uniref:uncharacterized protein LOC123654679 n=1 Tax=Melitaea cinxia TaxID=113334 RepID=UPI001E2731C3|nr:uncharacterized protein LOC123654679 [Melitaea cinxia]
MQNDPEFSPDHNMFLAFEEIYCIIKSIVQQLKGHTTPLSTEKCRLNLPPINLKTFDGELKNWPSFFECFNNAVHNNTNLSKSDKVFYLSGILSKSALTAISGIPPTADNYDLIIYSTLVDKYQDTRTLASTYLQQIINLKPLTTASADGLNVFLDKFAASVCAFDRLNISNKKDFIFLFLALQKLDKETIRNFELYVRSEKLPTYESLVKFIKEQVKIIERSSSNTFNTPSTSKNSYSKSSSHFAPKPVNNVKHTKSFITSESNNNCCPLCLKIGHEQFYRCPKFLKLTPKERYNIVKENNSCCNCLSFNHKTFLCKSNKSCSICESKTHHTLLHFHKNLTSSPASGIEPRLTAEQNPATHAPHTAESSGATNYSPAISSSYDASHAMQPLSMCSNTLLTLRDAHTVLLATARIVLRTSDGYEYIARALIDNGSMNDFVTINLCKKLSLKINSLPEKVTVNGFGGSSKEVKGQTNIKFYSRFDRNISFNLQPLVVENITDRIPTLPIDRSMLAYLSRTPLADDTFSDPGEVEMLIGAKLFTRLLLPTGIQTPLGFILMGDAPVKCRSHRTAAPPSHTLCAFTGQPLDVLMRSFWETEEVSTPRSALLSHEEKVCEDLYKSSTTREATGTYVVSLPFKTNPSALGDSMQSSKSRFFALEKRFLRDPNYRTAYNNIITDYCDKDYISPISADSKLPSLTYVIPHHGVIREDKITTKIRMVLDASARTDTGVSLNDILFSGPNLQADLFIILLNFRLLPIALCADVEQMYLRIKVHPQFYKFQQILYRFNTSDPIQLFEFKRVCFGLTSSPFLALRTLRQLADDEKNNFPLASEVINGGFFFMDDICCSINDVHSAQKVASQLIDMFAAGGFKLHKWLSNSPEVLSSLPQNHLHPQSLNFSSTATQKVLGVTWEPHEDNFNFFIRPAEVPCTKRNMLSVIARLWDVMGFAAPLIMFAKLLIKELWLIKLDWDDEPPSHIQTQWTRFQSELPLLSNLSLPRHIGVTHGCNAALLGFSDASEMGYGAVLYVRIQSEDGVSVRLLCAKSKVAPVQTISLARARPKPAQPPVMADLPTCRLKISKPFAHTGVDYGGPLMITLTRRRGIKSQKAYLCAFVCLTTRAVHIEVATDLSTDAFLNAFKRFISRRGPVERIYSDHGTNFVGAKSYLTEIQQFLKSNAFSEDFKTELAKNRISWEMIPPNAPHFGGGWEATIKSFKTHLFRVIGSQILTYEELLTVLCQIEAILNSRPLGILSEDPAEPLPLTPAHFLNTTPLAYLPSPNVEKDKPNLLSRFMLLDGLVCSYWRRWSDEYLHSLQIRQKWNTDVPKVYKRMIVLIMRDNSPPLHWP